MAETRTSNEKCSRCYGSTDTPTSSVFTISGGRLAEDAPLGYSATPFSEASMFRALRARCARSGIAPATDGLRAQSGRRGITTPGLRPRSTARVTASLP